MDNAREFTAALEAIVDDRIGAYEGALVAHRVRARAAILAYHDQEVPFAEEFDPRVMVLRHLIAWWERVDSRRRAVEDEIRRFAQACLSDGAEGLRSWSVWADPNGQPFGEEGTNGCPAPPMALDTSRRALIDVPFTDTDELYGYANDLAGIERFWRLRVLHLRVEGRLANVRALEHITGLFELHVIGEEPLVAQVAAELDLSAFPELRQLSLDYYGGALLEFETGWIRHARRLRSLNLNRMVPAAGNYSDIAAAPQLEFLRMVIPAASDVASLQESLPHTLIIALRERPSRRRR